MRLLTCLLAGAFAALPVLAQEVTASGQGTSESEAIRIAFRHAGALVPAPELEAALARPFVEAGCLVLASSPPAGARGADLLLALDLDGTELGRSAEAYGGEALELRLTHAITISRVSDARVLYSNGGSLPFSIRDLPSRVSLASGAFELCRWLAPFCRRKLIAAWAFQPIASSWWSPVSPTPRRRASEPGSAGSPGRSRSPRTGTSMGPSRCGWKAGTPALRPRPTPSPPRRRSRSRSRGWIPRPSAGRGTLFARALSPGGPGYTGADGSAGRALRGDRSSGPCRRPRRLPGRTAGSGWSPPST